jgi:eukaryotic-like serine/threonine-protein kinase
MLRGPEVLGGRYQLLDVIARGGMGVVYRARDRVLDRVVAVKVLPAEFAEDPTLVERFTREARAAARLSHPNIVAVYDTGHDGALRYFVMEYVVGQSLAHLLHERGALEVSEAVGIASDIASALAAAHTEGIVHRDIKPANVMVEPSGVSKVLDFGIARMRADAALTRTAMILGSAPYMSPEVARGESADERSDIYSLGCVLYEMLTGTPPFTGDLAEAVMNQQISVTPRPPSELRPSIPPALDALVLQMLAKDPDARPQHAAELVPALRGSLEPATALTAAQPTAPIATEATRRESAAPARPVPPSAPRRPRPPSRPPPPQRSWRRAWLVLAAILAAAVAGAAVAIAVGSGSGNQASTTSSHRSTPNGSSPSSSSSTRAQSRTSPPPPTHSTPTPPHTTNTLTTKTATTSPSSGGATPTGTTGP